MISLQFVSANDIGSETIGWFSAGHLSHVDACWREDTLLGARFDNPSGYGRGVQVRHPDYESFSRRVIATIPATDEQGGVWQRFLTQQIGKPYDWRCILAFALNRDWREEDSWICSELQARALEVAGIVPRLFLACNKVTPVALALAVSAIPDVRITAAPNGVAFKSQARRPQR